MLTEDQREQLIQRTADYLAEIRRNGNHIFNEQYQYLRDNVPCLFPDETEK